jgi:urea transporter
VILVFMLFFADSGERAIVQGLMIGSVVAVVVATLLVLRVLDQPFQSGVGGLRPVAMERTLTILDEACDVLQQADPAPCDESGTPS